MVLVDFQVNRRRTLKRFWVCFPVAFRGLRTPGSYCRDQCNLDVRRDAGCNLLCFIIAFFVFFFSEKTSHTMLGIFHGAAWGPTFITHRYQFYSEFYIAQHVRGGRFGRVPPSSTHYDQDTHMVFEFAKARPMILGIHLLRFSHARDGDPAVFLLNTLKKRKARAPHPIRHFIFIFLESTKSNDHRWHVQPVCLSMVTFARSGAPECFQPSSSTMVVGKTHTVADRGAPSCF